jgi:hypothetical protein
VTTVRHHAGEPLAISLPARAGEVAGLAVACTDAVGVAVPAVAATMTLSAALHTLMIPALAAPDVLTVVASSATRRATMTIDVRGVRYATREDARNDAGGTLADPDDKRMQWALGCAEATIERITGRTWCRSVAVIEGRTDRDGRLRCGDVDPISVRGAFDAATDTAISTAGLTPGPWRVCGFGASTWVRAVLVHGAGPVPAEIHSATVRLARAKVHQLVSAIPDRAERWQVLDGGALVSLAMPGANKTGIPEVDAVLGRYAMVAIG